LYSRRLSSIAIKQSEGNIEEAVFLLRAYRSTLERKYYTNISDTKDGFVKRRISASFKDIEGGQILGASYDYTHRLLDFSLVDEKTEEIKRFLEDFDLSLEARDGSLRNIPKVVDSLRDEGILEKIEFNDNEPSDITKEALEFPSNRSERLQSLTRGSTGAVNALAYSAFRSCGIEHPTVGELRVIDMPLVVLDDYYIGEVEVTEVETLIPIEVNNDGKKERGFSIGYGVCFGQNETKAISMSILDRCLEEKNKDFPTGDEEFVLYSIDVIESSGFMSHLKLPHYVTFNAELHSVRNTREGKKDE
ncbi:MAG: carbon-phosphorus lyase complex subunit PhnI, partial [Clostridium sp.]|uniref:carbon-phosphorus lyase complex subunit PhnI n=1 Tax=Clostridium sp. TaxID=1506 RepID=UPI003F3BD480